VLLYIQLDLPPVQHIILPIFTTTTMSYKYDPRAQSEIYKTFQFPSARLEPLPLGNSQAYPIPSYPNMQNASTTLVDDVSLEPTMAVLSTSLRLLQAERAQVRHLNCIVHNLQTQLQECKSVSESKDARIKVLEEDYERASNALNHGEEVSFLIFYVVS